MVNIIRDVAEDCGKSNRIYLPKEDMDRFGYTLEDLRCRVYSPRLQELLKYEADLAETFFAEAEREYNLLSPEDKAALIPAQAMALIYHTILDKMKASGFRIFDIRYRVNTFHKLWLLFRTKLDIDPQSYYDKSKAYYDKLVGFLSRPGRKDENRSLPGEPWKSCGFFSRPCKNYPCPENRVPVGVAACKTPWPPCFLFSQC